MKFINIRELSTGTSLLSAWLKEKANDLPPLEETLLKRRYNLLIRKRFLCWRGMSCGPLSSVAKTKFGSGLPWIERPEKSSPMPAVIAAKTPVEYSGIAYHPLIKKPSFSVIIGTRIRPSFRASNIALWVKKRGKRLILSVGIIELFLSITLWYIRILSD